MDKDNNKSSESSRTSKSDDNLISQSTANLLESSLNLKNNFTRASTDFALVIEELEIDLNSIRKKFSENDGFVKRKDLQIERLVSYYNKVERIINSFDTLFVQLKIQNIIIENALSGKILKDENFRKEFLNLKY